MPEPQRIERTVLIPAGLDEVWDALTRREWLSEWFGAEVLELDVRRGGRFAIRTPDDSLRRAVIEEVRTRETLIFRWIPIEEHASGYVRKAAHTTVEIRLEETADGTRVVVVESALFALKTMALA